MKKALKFTLTFLLCVVAAMSVSMLSFAADEKNEKWIGAWGTGPTSVSLENYGNIRFIARDMSARTVLTPTASGKKIRIKFSNYYGKSNLTLSNVTVAESAGVSSTDPNAATSKIDKSTIKVVTFNGGYPGFTLKPGQEIYSDPINFDLKAMQNIAVSFYADEPTEISTMGLSGATTFIGFNGNQTQIEEFGIASVINDSQVTDLIRALFNIGNLNINYPLAYKIVRVVPAVVNVDVLSEEEDAYSVVVIGDSTVANQFPVFLGERIYATGTKNVGVVGKGIIGNMLCGTEETLASELYGENLLKRIKRDIGKYTNVKYVIVKIGANDIIHPVCGDNVDKMKQPTSKELIAALKEVCDIVHKEFGAKVIFSTITQWKGTTRDYFGTGPLYDRTTAQLNADWKIALDVNDWITDSSNTYHDGYVDLAAISGPIDSKTGLPTGYFYPEYSEDAIHPTDELQKIWAEKFPLGLIGVSNKVANIRLNASSKTVYTGVSSSIKVSQVLPANAADKSVYWTSSNESVATVKASGKNGHTGQITALKNGTTLIRCYSNDGSAVASCVVTVKTHVSSVSVPSTATLYSRKTLQLKATVSPSTASDKSVKWKSSNTNVATVSSNGLVTAVGSGTAKITCTTNESNKSAVCNVTVKRPIDVLSLSVNKSSASIYKGSSYQISANVSPVNATFPELKWSTSNKKVATVSSAGLVKAVGAGTAYITCTSIDNPTASAKVKITVKVKATGVELSKSKTSVYEGYTKTLKATVLPSDATNKGVTWSSLNTSIATVDKNGVVKGKKAGTATIVCKTNDGGYTAKCTVTVIKLVKVKSVKLNYTSKTIKDGKTLTLKATITPSDASIKTVYWSSNDTRIAKVNSKGVVTGVNPGTCTITCTTKDGEKVAKCKITVTEVKPSSVELNKTTVSVKAGSTYQLKATVSPENATNKKVKWKSSDTSIVKVSSSGKITAVKPGTAKITCTTVKSGKSVTCTVKVKHVYISSVKITKSSADLAYGKTLTLKTKIKPSNATSTKLTWTSSNTKVATVDQNGKVKAVGEGKALISCKPAKGSGEGSACVVTVTKISVLGIKLNTNNIVFGAVGKTYQLTGTVVPETASDKRVIWSTSDGNVATVSNKGLVTARGKGTCTIRATAVDGGYIVTCKVTVK